MGETLDASWPKTGSGSYADPYKPLSASSTAFTNWYGSVPSQKGQIYSASLYDRDNPNRLVNLLPNHISTDISNKQFLDFMDMIGQQFDELWTYTKAVADVTDRQNDLREGFSKDLIYILAKSSGCNVQFYPQEDNFKFDFKGQLLCASSDLVYTKLKKEIF